MRPIESTPNGFLKILPLKSLGNKPQPDFDGVSQTAICLPLKWTNEERMNGSRGFQPSRILGSGDWGGTISDGHSVALEYDSYVVKFPVGKMLRDHVVLAKQRSEIIKRFSGISPRTFIIIAADAEGNPKPVTIQQRIEGRPACKTPFNLLLKKNALQGMKDALQKARKIYEETGLFDMIGQRFCNRTIARLIGSHPFFSDNIMVDDKGKVSLVDNTPDYRSHNYSQIGNVRRVLQNLRFKFLLGSLDLFITYASFKEKLARMQGENIHPDPTSVLTSSLKEV